VPSTKEVQEGEDADAKAKRKEEEEEEKAREEAKEKAVETQRAKAAAKSASESPAAAQAKKVLNVLKGLDKARSKMPDDEAARTKAEAKTAKTVAMLDELVAKFKVDFPDHLDLLPKRIGGTMDEEGESTA
jgi:hypothetical protein